MKPTNPITILRKELAANPNDTDALRKLRRARFLTKSIKRPTSQWYYKPGEHNPKN